MAQGDGKDPFGVERGKTILRTPGGGPRSGSGPDTPMVRPPSPGSSKPPPARPSAMQPAALADFLGKGHNPLVGAAAPLLVLGTQLRGAAQQPDVDGLRRQAMQEVRAFEQRAQAMGVSEDLVRIARYVLCTFVDLAVFATPWGGQSQWAAQSLLSAFERETRGGEKFLQILDKALADPVRYLDLIELQYYCMALGLELGGGGHEVGPQKRELEERALDTLRRSHREVQHDLSPSWEGVSNRRNPVRDLVPWWMAVLAGLVIASGGYLYWRSELNAEARPIKVALAQDALPVSYAATPAPAAPSRLKTLLASQEQAGQLVVEEFGDRALVTLAAPELFRSASATVDPAYTAILEAIGDAARQVGGQLVVVGHTDDLPIRSLRFQDNFELSRARAMSVAAVLEARGVRVEWKGVGDTQPRYEPPSTAENRARNRRVEILHFADRGAP